MYMYSTVNVSDVHIDKQYIPPIHPFHLRVCGGHLSTENPFILKERDTYQMLRDPTINYYYRHQKQLIIVFE